MHPYELSFGRVSEVILYPFGLEQVVTWCVKSIKRPVRVWLSPHQKDRCKANSHIELLGK